MEDFRQLFHSLEDGDRKAAAELLPLVYDELRKLAARKLANEPVGQTLQSTSLVHEAYLRLVGDEESAAEPRWDHPGHFFAAAAEAMRRILVENARRKQRLKHGQTLTRQELTEMPLIETDLREDLLDLDTALTKLATADPTAADLVKLRYFAGLTIPEAAATLKLAPRTVSRLWDFARAWLRRELKVSPKMPE